MSLPPPWTCPAQKQILEELLLVRESFGTAMVLVSHNLGLVAAMADGCW